LNSSKVMVVLGTRPEHFNAVWVKNEWSRYLALIKNGADKVLIPAYRDMDPYDLPKEFSHLQAQDMRKLAFMQDLIRGIKELTEDSKAAAAKETVVFSAGSDAAALLKRAFMCLEDGEWDRADEFCEQVLNIDPECAQAHLGKLMAELHVHSQDTLKDCTEPFSESKNYQKLLRLADEKLCEELKSDIDCIIERKKLHPEGDEEVRRKEAARKNRNKKLLLTAAVIACVLVALVIAQNTVFASGRQYREAVALMGAGNYEEAIAVFEALEGYQDSAARIIECEIAILEREYGKAVALMAAARYEEAITAFETLDGYKDSLDKIAGCQSAILDIKYQDILALMAAGRFEEAIAMAEAFGEYRDNSDILAECHYLAATAQMNAGDTLGALRSFTELGDYKDAKAQADELRVRYQKMLQKPSLAAGSRHTVALKADGTIVAVGSANDVHFTGSGWQDIVAVDAAHEFTIGLKADGSVAVMGSFEYARMGSIYGWRDIASTSTGSEPGWLRHAIGLRSDGTVVAAGFGEFGRCNVEGWRDIVAISTGYSHTVGLKSDGTVVAVGDNGSGCCNVSGWKDIIAVCGRNAYTVGLKKDGTVVAVGENLFGQINISDWKDIIAISTQGNHTVGLKADGTVVATGYNEYGQCNVSGWTDIVAISAGSSHTVGLKADGTVVAVGYNKDGQCDVSGWTNIRLPG